LKQNNPNKQVENILEPKLFHKFSRFHRNPIFNLMLNDRLRRLVKTTGLKSNGKYFVLDVGCGRGYLSNYIANRISGLVVGMEVSKTNLSGYNWAKNLDSQCEITFILGDINHLPFKEDAFDLMICASILEHVTNLEGAIKEMAGSIKKNGRLIAGYPIETKLFMVLVKMFARDWMSIRDPNILGIKEFESNPDTHKQSFVSIRCALGLQFSLERKEKSFVPMFPDILSWYECSKMKRN
jgi:ubiquinone/menaquinone biosynthesis C-methylase UbiE